MPYVLGIDLGGWRTAAAVSRLVNGASGAVTWSEVEAVPLGVGTTTVPSVLYVLPDGSLHAGEPGPFGKGRAVFGFARRVGDDVPLIIGGEPYTGQALLAALAMWVVELVEEREGDRADQIVISHPGGWGPYRVELLHRALWRSGLDTVTLLPAPVAIAEAYAAEVPVSTGAMLATHDFGGGESGVVRRTDMGTFELLGCADGAVDSDADGYPGGIEPLLDDALLGYVGQQLRLNFEALDPLDPSVREGVGRMREQCAAARERLATEAEAVIAVELQALVNRVVITREGFDDLVRPLLFTALDTLRSTVRSCGVAAGELAAVVLAGDAARMPLVNTLASTVLPARVAVGPQPELRAVRGTALAAARMVTGPADPDAHGDLVEYTGGQHAIYRPSPGPRAGLDHRPQSGRHPSPGHRGGNAVERFDGDRTREHHGGQHAGGEYVGGEYAEPEYADPEYTRLDYPSDDLGDPPPRPPVRITPLDLPKRGPRLRLRRGGED